MSIRLSVLALALLLASCGPAPASPTQPAAASTTQPLFPSETPSPTQTSSPTAVPYLPLQTDGPYLLHTDDGRNFTILDADGSGRKQFQLPNDGYIFQLNNSISPDGKQLAYFTGSIETPYDIALNLFNILDETTLPISNLLAPGFPANLDPLVETMVLGDPPIYDIDCFEDMECRRSLVARELTLNRFPFVWSPDSRSMAFVAQIDDPSSDIYIYSISNSTITRLTNEPQNIYWLDWAPNGQSIIFEISAVPGTYYEGRTLHVSDLQGLTVPISDEHLYKMRWGEVGWFTQNIYLLYHPNDTDKPPVYDLMTVDTDTGEFHQIWPYSVEYFAVDTENQAIILYHRDHETWPSTIPEGLYMVYPNGEYRKISDIAIPLILMQGRGPYPVLAKDHEDRMYTIRSDGSLEELAWGDRGIPVISPNGNLLLFHEQNELVLFSSTSNEPIRTWSMQQVIRGIKWNPDSSGVFLSTDMNFYYLDISSDKPIPLLENCAAQECSPVHSVWLP